MIEKLYPEDYPFGEPGYSSMEKQIETILAALRPQLHKDGTDLLDQLDRACRAQCDAAVRDAFAVGFRTAVELVADIRENRRA